MKLKKELKYNVNGRIGQYELTTVGAFSRECFFMDDTNMYEYFRKPIIKMLAKQRTTRHKPSTSRRA